MGEELLPSFLLQAGNGGVAVWGRRPETEGPRRTLEPRNPTWVFSP